MSTFEDSAPLVEALRENIREAKRKSGLTIDRLADEAGISRTAVIKLLSNSKIDSKLTDIAALCRYFICPLTACSACIPNSRRRTRRKRSSRRTTRWSSKTRG